MTALLLALLMLPQEAVVQSGHAACVDRSDVLMLDQIARVEAKQARARWYDVARSKILEGRCVLTDSTPVEIVATDDTTDLVRIRLVGEKDDTLWIHPDAFDEKR